MKHLLQLLAVSTALLLSCTASHTAITASTGENDVYEVAQVCYPEVDDFGSVPPCISIAKIEAACQPNGTDGIDYNAHAQCMCQGSYFTDWTGCQNCLFVHGYRSARDHVYWEGVLSVASSSLCQGTPTALFQAIFTAAQADTQAAPIVTTGDTKSVDEFPSQTDVSLYYTTTPQASHTSAANLELTAPNSNGASLQTAITGKTWGITTLTTRDTSTPASESTCGAGCGKAASSRAVSTALTSAAAADYRLWQAGWHATLSTILFTLFMMACCV
ncbi:collagen-like protein Mcl1 [Pochonia chlamydosporia 170]|uniref:Collagen-like protein Mcl1 n=1 Tax=Pochonia chlamydosporia 170 TaxID=1380566 RepID=A0A179FAG9_METCM|nr:collagen-like protein Mcl1 [Pochonia chlamydosporia 170]OAQ62073.1 collagen-like protein Mcl1 [Pochonia chlamydosporia 170]